MISTQAQTLLKFAESANHIWFARTVNRLSPDEIQAVISDLEGVMSDKFMTMLKTKIDYAYKQNGTHPTPKVKTKRQTKSRTYWTEEQWDILFELVWNMRKNHPESSLAKLTKKAIKQFPEDERRSLAGPQLNPLKDRLKKRYQKLSDDAETLIKLQGKIQSKEEILNALTFFEIQNRFKSVILNHISIEDLKTIPKEKLLKCFETTELASTLVQRFLDTIRDTQVVKPVWATPPLAPPKPSPAPPKVKPYQVVIVGPLDSQIPEIQKGVNSKIVLRFIKKDKGNANMEAIPVSDAYIAWVGFVSHSHTQKMKEVAQGTNGKFIMHKGGIQNMITLINNLPNAE